MYVSVCVHACLHAGIMLSARGGLWQSLIFYNHVDESFILLQHGLLLVL